jgi:ketosteroid isomerase-like protein
MSTDLEARLQRLEEEVARLRRADDELAIQRVIVDYAKYLDARDYEGYVGLFAKEAVWTNPSGTHKGAAAIYKMVEGYMGPANAPNQADYHITSNIEVDVDDDRAKAVSRWLFIERNAEGVPTPTIGGLYRDEFVREDGRWKFSRRVAENLMPTPEDRRRRREAQQAKQ